MPAPASLTAVPPILLTFRQYRRRYVRDLAQSYGLSMAEVERETSERQAKAEWWTYLDSAFDAGGDFTPHLWRSLGRGEWLHFLRRPRALRDEALTSRLLALLPDGWAA